MCGLVGGIGFFAEDDKRAFRTMLRLDVIRGEDSTGVAAIGKHDDKIRVYKRTGAPDLLFNQYPDDWGNNGIYKGPAPKILIGHNRWATKGSVTDKNAHPFHHGPIVGAHNGTLTDVLNLEKGHTFEVDSEAIFYNLSKYAPEDVINDVYGAYALTWYDQDEDKLFVIRNHQRTLYWTRRLDRDVIFWSSRKDILELSLDLAHIKYGKVEDFKPNTLYSFDAEAVSDGDMRKTDWEIKENVFGYSPPPPPPKPVTTYHGGSSNNVTPFPGTSSITSTSSSVVTQERTKEEIETMKSLQGQKILFRIKGPKKGMGKMEYLSCYPDNPMFDWDIRLFAHKHRNWGKWKGMAHGTTFQGEVRRLVTTWNGPVKENYLLIDLRTVSEHVAPKEDKGVASAFLDEVDKEEYDDDQKFYQGFNGVFLTHKEFLKATARGCAGCSKDADEEDEELVFLADDDFLCGDCASLELYREYIPHMK